MKKTIGVAAGGIILVVIALAMIPTIRDEIHWQWASHKNETTSYESYVNTWPGGRYAAEARGRYDELGWADAQAVNTVQGYERYVQFHGNGKYVTEAKDNIETLQWQEAVVANTIQGFEQYLERHPDGKRVSVANEGIESLHRGEPFAATALFNAVRNGCIDSAEILLKAGVNPNIKNTMSLLGLLSRQERMRFLILSGDGNLSEQFRRRRADIELLAITKIHITPLDIAKRDNNKNMVQILEKYGANSGLDKNKVQVLEKFVASLDKNDVGILSYDAYVLWLLAEGHRDLKDIAWKDKENYLETGAGQLAGMETDQFSASDVWILDNRQHIEEGGTTLLHQDLVMLGKDAAVWFRNNVPHVLDGTFGMTFSGTGDAFTFREGYYKDGQLREFLVHGQIKGGENINPTFFGTQGQSHEHMRDLAKKYLVKWHDWKETEFEIPSGQGWMTYSRSDGFSIKRSKP